MRGDPTIPKFLAIWGQHVVLVRYLSLAVAVSLGANLVQAIERWRLQDKLLHVEPIYVAVYEDGRADVRRPATRAWRDPDLIKNQLRTFTLKHFSRHKATLAQEYPESLLLFEPQTRSTLARGGKADPSRYFVENPMADEIRVRIERVRLDDIDSPTMRAAVDFVEERWPVGSLEPTSVLPRTAHYAFRHDPDAAAPWEVNPLRLQILGQPRIDDGQQAAR